MATQTIDTEALNSRFDLRQLADPHTTLRRESSTELAGPCPRCGGEDRFHVAQDFFFCRHCYPLDNGQPHDAIALIRWLHACSFLEAVSMLDANATKSVATQPKPPQRTAGQTRPDADWFSWAPQAHAAAKDALWAGDNPVRSYLLNRGFTDDTLIVWGIGYAANAQNRGPAVVIPWFRGPDLYALHYRFLDGQPKMTFAKGSKPAGLLCGRHAFRQQPGHTLFIVEGELNAMSISQVTRADGVDVLSMGGESAALTPAAVAFAQAYARRFVWMDREELAKQKAAQIGGGAVWSLTVEDAKCDANELLQRWALRPMLDRLMGA